MTREEFLAFGAGVDGVAVETASADSGAPQVAWGDSFFFYAPGERRFPFATLVRGDYPGFDEFSQLTARGAYRVNLAVGRQAYDRLVGGAPDADFTAYDVLLPHPVYGSQGWVCVVNPGARTSDQVRELFVHCRDLAAARHERRDTARPGSDDEQGAPLAG